jgi:WD40 repeat protein
VHAAVPTGMLVIWDGLTSSKKVLIEPTKTTWWHTCRFSSDDKMLAAGGLDNTVTIWKLNGLDDPEAGKSLKPHMQLEKHLGPLNDIKWMNNNNDLLSCSGDHMAILWDVNTKRPKSTFKGHTGDVNQLCILDENTFVSGSSDHTCKLWDLRAGGTQCAATFVGHEDAVNSVATFPDGKAFGTASDDGTSRLFDTRAMAQLCIYAEAECDESSELRNTAVAFNKTGSTLFTGSSDGAIIAWEVASGDFEADNFEELYAHTGQVNHLDMSPDGKALLSTSKQGEPKGDTICIWA